MSAGGNSLEVDVEGSKQELGPLLGAVGAHVASCSILSDGTLAIGLDNGTRITVPPAPQFEAWEIRTPTERLVCQPGGVVSTW